MACSTTTGMYLGVSTTICATGSASRSGNTVTISGTVSVSQGNSWNLNAIYATINGYTGWIKVKPYSNSGGSWSANYSFSFTDANAGSRNFSAVFQVYNNAESGGVGAQASVGYSVSWGSNVSQPANPSITCQGSTNTSLSFRLHESNWGNSPGRWEWWFTDTQAYSGAADSTYNHTPTSGYTSNGTADVSKTGLTSNRYYWVHLRAYNQRYNNPGGISESIWVTRPQNGEYSVIDRVVPATNYLPFPYSSRPQQSNGITFTDNGDGSITLNGRNDDTAASKFYIFSGTTAGDPPITLQPGTYHFSAPLDQRIYFTMYDGSSYKSVTAPDYQFTITEPKTYVMMSIDVAKGSTAQFNNLSYTPKLYDDTGEVNSKVLTWKQWTGNADLELRLHYRIEQGDKQAPAEDTWTTFATIPAGAGMRSKNKEGEMPFEGLAVGQTYTVFLMTSNYNGYNNGSGRSGVQRIVFSTAPPPEPEITYQWNDTRDTLSVYASAPDTAQEIQVAYGYTNSADQVISGLNGTTRKTGQIQYPNHGTGQKLYLFTRVKASGNWFSWKPRATVNVPNPILGIAVLPNGTKKYIVDIVESKKGGKNLLKLQNMGTTDQSQPPIILNDNAVRTTFTKEAGVGTTGFIYTPFMQFEPNTDYVLSFNMTGAVSGLNKSGMARLNNGPTEQTWTDKWSELISGNRYKISFTTGDTGVIKFAFYRFWNDNSGYGSGTIEWTNVQLEKGTEPTAFAPYDPPVVTPQWQNGVRIVKKQ